MLALTFAKLFEFARQLRSAEDGQDLVEYGLLLLLIALGAITAISPLAKAITPIFSNASSSIT